MASILDTIAGQRAEQEAARQARQLNYRRAFASEAGRQVLADMARAAGVHQASVPYDAERRLDVNEMARREGARAFVLEVMALAGAEMTLEFPPLDATQRPDEIETEKAA